MRASDLNIDRIYINKITRSENYRMVTNHVHYYYEIFYVSQGICRFFIDGRLFDLHSGDLLVIPPREVHYNRYLSQCTRINLYFRSQDLQALAGERLGEIEDYLRTPRMFHIPGSCRSVIEDLLASMLREDKIDDPLAAGILLAQLCQLSLYIRRYGAEKKEASALPPEGDQAILHITEYIRSHYSEPLRLETLSELAGLSPSYFSRRFKIVTGMRTMEYINYVRLTNASQELLSTDHTITEVAMHNGFSDSNYFKDSFRRAYGESPRAYRKNRYTDSHIQEISLREKTPSSRERPFLQGLAKGPDKSRDGAL